MKLITHYTLKSNIQEDFSVIFKWRIILWINNKIFLNVATTTENYGTLMEMNTYQMEVNIINK